MAAGDQGRGDGPVARRAVGTTPAPMITPTRPVRWSVIAGNGAAATVLSLCCHCRRSTCGDRRWWCQSVVSGAVEPLPAITPWLVDGRRAGKRCSPGRRLLIVARSPLSPPRGRCDASRNDHAVVIGPRRRGAPGRGRYRASRNDRGVPRRAELDREQAERGVALLCLSYPQPRSPPRRTPVPTGSAARRVGRRHTLGSGRPRTARRAAASRTNRMQ